MRWCLTFLQPFDEPYNHSINKADGSSTTVKGSETASMVKYNFEKDDVKEHRGQVDFCGVETAPTQRLILSHVSFRCGVLLL